MLLVNMIVETKDDLLLLLALFHGSGSLFN